MSIAAAAYLASDWDLSERLRKVSIMLYLELTISLSIQAAILVYWERRGLSEFFDNNANPQHVWLNTFRVSLG